MFMIALFTPMSVFHPQVFEKHKNPRHTTISLITKALDNLTTCSVSLMCFTNAKSFSVWNHICFDVGQMEKLLKKFITSVLSGFRKVKAGVTCFS